MSGETGECILSSCGPDLRIERADPVIRIVRRMIDDAAEETRRDDAVGYPDSHRRVILRGDVLTIKGRNRTVVYRIDREDYDVQGDNFRAEWPD